MANLITMASAMVTAMVMDILRMKKNKITGGSFGKNCINGFILCANKPACRRLVCVTNFNLTAVRQVRGICVIRGKRHLSFSSN